MISHEARSLISSRATAAGLSINDDLLDRLQLYLRLLAHWNTRINLTGFTLDEPSAAAIDRLLIEPLLISQALSYPVRVWFDLGSGGGSPAIPIQLSRPAQILVLVESKLRKAAFLREVTREMQLAQVEVESRRIESVAASHPLVGTADLVTVRAVRPSESLLSAIRALLRRGGQAALIGSKTDQLETIIDLQVVPVVEFALSDSLLLLSKA
jgi:16S rRNA (guanine527-N7)-methyltransferase